MRVQGRKASPRRRGLPKDEGQRSVIAGNVLDHQFTADAPNQMWVADFTYIWTPDGWLYAPLPPAPNRLPRPPGPAATANLPRKELSSPPPS